MSYYQYFCKKKSNVYISRIDHTRDSRWLVAACRMVLLAGRALSSALYSVYAGIWCPEKAGYFYDRLCGYTVCRVTECGHWGQLRILTIVITTLPSPARQHSA